MQGPRHRRTPAWLEDPSSPPKNDLQKKYSFFFLKVENLYVDQ